MIDIYCDICKKLVPNPSRYDNYMSVLDKELCMSCHNKLKEKTEQILSSRPKFQLNGYHSVLADTLKKMCK